MHEIISAVEQLVREANARIECPYTQGHQPMVKYLQEKGIPLAHLGKIIKEYQQERVRLQKLVLPYVLPPDYLFFLDYYGGLSLENSKGIFWISGIGPMAESFYGAERPEDEFITYPFFIAMYRSNKEILLDQATITMNQGLSPFDEDYIYPSFEPWNWIYYIDLIGRMKKDSILQLSIADDETWHVVADSFSEWLNLVADRKGGLPLV